MKASPTGVHANDKLYVRTREHAKIKAIADEHLADCDPIDFTKPGKLEALTLLVGRKMAPGHKYYKAMVESKEPTKQKLYKSLFDFLYKIYVRQEEPVYESTQNEQPDTRKAESNEEEEYNQNQHQQVQV